MEPIICLSGETIKLQCRFYDWQEEPRNLKDPDLVKLIVYDYNYKKIEEIVLGPINKVGIGEYIYFYTAPQEVNKRLYMEFYGEIDGNTSINRFLLVTKFHN